MNVSINVQNLEQVNKKLIRMIPAVHEEVCKSVSAAVITALQDEPPENHSVTRKMAYGVSFFTKKQRAYFFWALKNGIIRVPYKRTGGMKNAWRTVGRGKDIVIINDTRAALFTVDNKRQARLNRLMGWKTIDETIKANSKAIAAAVLKGVWNGLKRAGFDVARRLFR